MHLTPKERDRLTLFTVAELARRRRARGRRLNAPEAIALISDEIIERAWDGEPLSAVVEAARSVLTADDVMDGVPQLVRRIEVDCLFPSGSALVAVDDPIPDAASAPAPGAVIPAAEPLEANRGRARATVEVVNVADRPVAVSSHYPFDQVNATLRFPREAAAGMRLDVPAGSTVVFAPGERRQVALVAFGGSGGPPPLTGEARDG